jgi:uncharacterized coiled-coil DUF342 family protein
MDRYGYLVKKRASALGLFTKVLRKLDGVHEEMHRQVEESNAMIASHEATIKAAHEGIEDSKQAIAFLEAEKAKTLETRQKITALISG